MENDQPGQQAENAGFIEAHWANGIAGLVAGILFGPALSWILNFDGNTTNFTVLASVAFFVLAGIAASALEEKPLSFVPTWRAIRFLLDTSIRVLLLAWLIVWLQGYVEMRSALEKAKTEKVQQRP